MFIVIDIILTFYTNFVYWNFSYINWDKVNYVEMNLLLFRFYIYIKRISFVLFGRQEIPV